MASEDEEHLFNDENKKIESWKQVTQIVEFVMKCHQRSNQSVPNTKNALLRQNKPQVPQQQPQQQPLQDEQEVEEDGVGGETEDAPVELLQQQQQPRLRSACPSSSQDPATKRRRITSSGSSKSDRAPESSDAMDSDIQHVEEEEIAEDCALNIHNGKINPSTTRRFILRHHSDHKAAGHTPLRYRPRPTHEFFCRRQCVFKMQDIGHVANDRYCDEEYANPVAGRCTKRCGALASHEYSFHKYAPT